MELYRTALHRSGSCEEIQYLYTQLLVTRVEAQKERLND